VEGYTDVISMHQAGVENVVASSGTSLTVEQVKLLRRFTDNVTVIYDGDDAGIKASLRGIDMILREGLSVRVVLLPAGEDPDSFARSHNAAELQDFIRTSEQDFITFKAQVLMRETGGDVIKRAAVVTEMVASIAEIPDAIQRSMFIAECARVMEVDEQLLISEVAKKRFSGPESDSEQREFVRRQEAIRRAENAARATQAGMGSVTAGSSLDELEKELTLCLIKYGHENFDFRDGRSVTSLNVADTIIGELRANDFTLRNPNYRALYDTYASQHDEAGEGVEIFTHNFINHPDPEVSGAAVDLLTADDIYTLSKLWKRHEFSVVSERERLFAALPRAVLVYKSKVIAELSAELMARQREPDLPYEAVAEIQKRITALNGERTKISKRLSRLIL
jgi:DNA primase